jgi:large subunit ribosomal protein L9
VEALASDGFIVQRNQVDLADPIKSVGIHTVPLVLHAEVAVSIIVNVARSADEATRQAAGEDVTVHTFEADEGGDFAAGQADAANDDRFEE